MMENHMTDQPSREDLLRDLHGGKLPPDAVEYLAETKDKPRDPRG